MAEPSFTIGIEEEYHLVSLETRELCVTPPPEMLPACEELLTGRVSPEFMRSQIEVGTGVCSSIGEVRNDLAQLRRTVADVARRHGLAPIAASTHPFAEWDVQRFTEKERYSVLARDLQGVGRRLVICGMHVHVAVEDDELRIDLMNQVTYFLPHLLALSTSSPFWRGHDSGLKSYRMSVFNGLPRTGLPEYFASFSEYRRHVSWLVGAGLIEDATKLWWDVRPSDRFPTLEMRITDVCTRLDDAIAIAALYRCLLRMLWRLRRNNQRWRIYARMLVDENRWRAQRYGLDAGLVDFGKGQIVPCADLLEELIALTEEDALFFGCTQEIGHLRTILQRGTSAQRQLEVHARALMDGMTPEEALRRVVDMLVAETVDGL
ncbi:carboxylate-amine ligase [Telmatospirillum sp. J64-1]|uniref:carboxylate-amine ligase n=1 Tax=Telmatospirillum sp. J64-1 TaxID=2502183 RepID=UPI00115C9A98|nr:carboxylate-amine ligase [Telmatospirillum sp. J64-1]